MNRSLPRLTGALFLAVGVFALCFYLGSVLSGRGSNDRDELAYLRMKYNLSEEEFNRVAALHEQYKPVCQRMCARVDEKKGELGKALGGATNVTPEVEHKLAEMGALRAECQSMMLAHFLEVARALPPEKGTRYLEEMKRIALGLDEKTGPSLSVPATHDAH